MGQYLNGRGRKVLAALDAVAAETGATQAQIALAWIAAQHGITAPIASANHLDQLDELLGAMTLELSQRSEEHTSELQSLMRHSYADLSLQTNNTHETRQHKREHTNT